MLRRVWLLSAGSTLNGPLQPDLGLLDRVAAGIAQRLSVSCHVAEEPWDAGPAFEPGRGQYHSTRIIADLAQFKPAEGTAVLAVTELDLFVPVLTFVFGEAQLHGPFAIVSQHRLREEFYGLQPDPAKLEQRLLKEALHELGHTQGLRHCDDWNCAMASTHSVERLDIKDARYCDACLAVITRALQPDHKGS
jgi:archaemetzincin